MPTTKQTTPVSANPTEPAPVAIKTKRRELTPSVMTPHLAAVVQDVTSPAPSVSVTPTVSPSDTASATATPTPPQSIATGAVPVVTTPTTATSPVVAVPGQSASPNAVNPPPEQNIQSPPAGFVAPDPRDFLGYHPSSREIAAASTVVANLGSADSWVATFGSTVPSAATLATALSLGLEWGQMRSATEAWEVYVKAEYSMAWKSALLMLDQLKPVFFGAIAKDPALAQQYPGLMQMFDAPKAVAKQASATKKKNAKAKAAAAAPAAQAAAAAVTPAVPTATTAAAPAAATKTVTVSA